MWQTPSSESRGQTVTLGQPRRQIFTPGMTGRHSLVSLTAFVMTETFLIEGTVVIMNVATVKITEDQRYPCGPVMYHHATLTMHHRLYLTTTDGKSGYRQQKTQA
jgi:hypothetical protein